MKYSMQKYRSREVEKNIYNIAYVAIYLWSVQSIQEIEGSIEKEKSSLIDIQLNKQYYILINETNIILELIRAKPYNIPP